MADTELGSVNIQIMAIARELFPDQNNDSRFENDQASLFSLIVAAVGLYDSQYAKDCEREPHKRDTETTLMAVGENLWSESAVSVYIGD